jgi:hypothetical protein
MIRHHRTSLFNLYCLLLAGTGLFLTQPVLADPLPAPGGALIENTATGSFDDPYASTGSSVSVQSNTVSVTVAEVAGITAVAGALPQELSVAAAGAAAGTWQGNGVINTGDVVYVEFILKNVGNDPTQFFIPGKVGLIGGTLQGNVQVIEIDPDGAGVLSPIALPTNPINVPATGATTASLVTTIGNPTGLPNGSLPVGGTVKVRVPVKITASAGLAAVQVTLGDTGSNDNSAGTQNQVFSLSTIADRDLYTQDNANGAVSLEVAGMPFNGDGTNHRQEASATQSLNVVAVPVTVSGKVWLDADGNLSINAIGGNALVEVGTNAGSTALTVYAVDSGGLAIAKSLVASNGTYSLTLTAGSNYSLRLINNSTIALNTTAPSVSLPTGYINTGENFAGTTESTTPGEIAITNLSSNLIDYNFGIQQQAYCTIGSGTDNTSIQRYISTEVGNTSTAGTIPTNLRSFTNTLDDTWRVAAGGSNNGTAVPWFGPSTAPGSLTSFTYKEPGLGTVIATTVTPLRIPFDNTAPCNVIGSSYNNTSNVLYGNNLQDSSPRPSSLYTIGSQPGFWATTGSSGGTSRSAVKFTFSQPVKSFGAWFGDLETRTIGGSPGYLRLIDSSGNRIGQDIPIEPQNYYNGVAGTVQAVTQSSCSSTLINCGNQTTRWVGFIDSVAVARVKEVIVIVGDADISGKGAGEQLSFIGANYQSIPNLLLVKRITRVNDSTTTSDGVSTLAYIDETANPYDDNQINSPAVTPPDTTRWPVDTSNKPLLAGATNGGKIQPGKEIEYTIYFLSTGDGGAKNVVLCDRIPDYQFFSPNAFGAVVGGATANFKGIQVSLNGTVTNHTNIQDSDIGTYYPPTVSLPTACGTAPNIKGAVVVNLGDLPTASVSATASYGYVRFRTRTD